MNGLALKTFRFPENTCIAQAQPHAHESVTLASPALEVMTDLTRVKAATIEPATTLASAEQMMIHQGVRLLFVVSNFPCVDGLVTANDLIGDKPMRLVHQRNVRHDDLCVEDVMTRLEELDAIDYEALAEADVAAVVAAIRKFGRSHMLVVQSATRESAARIRGVISLTQLERQLGHAIMAIEIASSFAEIEKALQ